MIIDGLIAGLEAHMLKAHPCGIVSSPIGINQLSAGLCSFF